MCWEVDLLIKNLIYCAIFLAPLGSNIICLPVGSLNIQLYRIIVILATVILIWECVKKRKIFVAYRKNFYSVLFFVVWFIYMVVGYFWIEDFFQYRRIVNYFSFSIATIVLCNNVFGEKDDFVKAFFMMQWAVWVQICFGFYEVFTKHYLFVEPERIDNLLQGFYGFPIGTLYNLNDFAMLMYMSLSVSAVCIVNSAVKVRWIYVLSLVCELILIALSQCRGVYLGTVIWMFLYLLLYVKHKMLALMSICVFMMVGLMQYYDKLLALISFDFSMGSDYVRLNLIRNGLIFLKDSNFLGIGAGQIGEYMFSKSMFETGEIVDMHNWWMEILVSYGIFIFIGYLLFYFMLAKDMWRDYEKKSINSDEISTISLMIFMTMMGFIIACVSSSNNMTKEWLWVFWSVVIAYQGCVQNFIVNRK